MNQEESEQNEVDGMKKGADSTVVLCPFYFTVHFRHFPSHPNSLSSF